MGSVVTRQTETDRPMQTTALCFAENGELSDFARCNLPEWICCRRRRCRSCAEHAFHSAVATHWKSRRKRTSFKFGHTHLHSFPRAWAATPHHTLSTLLGHWGVCPGPSCPSCWTQQQSSLTIANCEIYLLWLLLLLLLLPALSAGPCPHCSLLSQQQLAGKHKFLNFFSFTYYLHCCFKKVFLPALFQLLGTDNDQSVSEWAARVSTRWTVACDRCDRTDSLSVQLSVWACVM